MSFFLNPEDPDSREGLRCARLFRHDWIVEKPKDWDDVGDDFLPVTSIGPSPSDVLVRIYKRHYERPEIDR
jgi:hypothetical protein